MGNRSKYVMGAATLAGLAAAARRRRARTAAEGIRATTFPASEPTWSPDTTRAVESHAPGHAHLPPPVNEKLSVAWRRLRPWAQRRSRPYEHF